MGKLIRTATLLFFVGLCCSFGVAAFAQDTGGGVGGGGGDIGGGGGDVGGGGGDDLGGGAVGGDTGNQGGDTSISEGEGLGEIRTFEIDQSEDTRNQGFVGATAPEIRDYFVGSATDATGSPLVGNRSGTDRPATFGGGVNDSVSSQFTGGTTAGRGGGQAGGFGGVENGVSITRRSIRAVLRPSFSAPRPSGNFVAARFNDHFSRQPGSESVGKQYSIKVQDRTGFLDGKVKTRADMDRLVRQLRLEPGVYKIVNRLQIATQ